MGRRKSWVLTLGTITGKKSQAHSKNSTRKVMIDVLEGRLSKFREERLFGLDCETREVSRRVKVVRRFFVGRSNISLRGSANEVECSIIVIQ